MSLSTFLLVHVFTAVLPPANDDKEDDFYHVLGISKNASLDEIRKAYRKKSLELHPDKVAQRQQSNQEEAAREYEKVQEAYGVLSDKKHRQEYNALGCSPARYRFVNTGGLSHPMGLYENLAKASFADKTRLVLLVTVFVVLLLLQPILLAAKVNAVVEKSGTLQDTKMVVILIPFWIVQGIIMTINLLLWFVVPKSVRFSVLVGFCEHLCWLLGMILLAQQWDDTRNASWHKISAPFYFAILFRILHLSNAATMHKKQQEKMVSPEYIHEKVGNLEDLNEEQREELNEKYIVVTVDTDTLTAALEALAEEGHEVTQEDIEAVRVHSSAEYAASIHAIRKAYDSVGNLVVYAIPFIALVASKLQGAPQVPLAIPSNDEDENQADEETGESANKDNSKSTDNIDKKKKKKEQEPDMRASSTAFADPEGNIEELNSPVHKDAAAGVPSFSKEAEMQNMDVDPEAPSDEDTQVPPDPPEVDERVLQGEGDEEKNEQGDDEEEKEPEIDLDEEAFRAWMHAQAQAESNAMEAASKAQGECCWSSFQFMIVCLIVGKVEEDYKSDDGDTGYSAFWILFPVFLVAGIFLCCCSCLIYNAGGDSSLDHLVERAKKDGDDSGESTAPPPPPHQEQTAHEETADEEAKQQEKNDASEPAPAVDEETGDIEDLD